MVQASKVLEDQHTHTHRLAHTHVCTWIHTSVIPAAWGWNTTIPHFCPDGREDTSLVHLCAKPVRTSWPARPKKADGQASSLGPPLSLSLIVLACFLGFKRWENTENLQPEGAEQCWGEREKKRGSVGTKWKTKGSGHKQGGKRRGKLFGCCWCISLDGATWA